MAVSNNTFDRREQRTVNAAGKRFLANRTFTREELLPSQERPVRFGDQVPATLTPRAKDGTTLAQVLNVTLVPKPGSNNKVWEVSVLDPFVFFEGIGPHFVLDDNFPVTVEAIRGGNPYVLGPTYVPPTASETETFQWGLNYDYGEVWFSDAPTDLTSLTVSFYRYRPSAFDHSLSSTLNTGIIGREVITGNIPAFTPYLLPGGAEYDNAADFAATIQVYLNGFLQFSSTQAYSVFGDDGVSDVFAEDTTQSGVVRFANALAPGYKIVVVDTNNSLSGSTLGRTIIQSTIPAGTPVQLPGGVVYTDTNEFTGRLLIFLNGQALYHSDLVWGVSPTPPDLDGDVFSTVMLGPAGTVKFAIQLEPNDRIHVIRL